MIANKLCGARGCTGVSRVVESYANPGKSGNHETIPGGQDLFVPRGRRPAVAKGEKLFFAGGQRLPGRILGKTELPGGFCDGLAFDEDIPASKFASRVVGIGHISTGLHTVVKGKYSPSSGPSASLISAAVHK